MENNLILSKESSESEIKRYFNAILELSKSDNEFPINLDEVWMLVYPRKDHAVRELVDSSQFIEGVDYQVFLKNGENPKGGRPTNEYKLTVSCMEFFIVRKVRPVFEVYRQVFHKVAKHELSRKELALMVLQSEEEKERLALEVQQKQITIELQEKEIKQAAPKVSYYDNHLQSVNTLTSTQVAKQIGMDAEKLHRKMKEIGSFTNSPGNGYYMLLIPLGDYILPVHRRTHVLTVRQEQVYIQYGLPKVCVSSLPYMKMNGT